jgi:succinate dehydrogenase/fumarate reductase flavoprotein subunit
MTEVLETIESDVLIDGAGRAGTRAAIELARECVNVLLVSKGPIGQSRLTVIGGGGVAVATRNEPSDSLEPYFRGTAIQGALPNLTGRGYSNR